MEATYARIVTDIRRRIEAGELAPGDRVPSTRQIVATYEVAMATATKVLAVLQQQGLVRAVPGVGTLVTDRRPGAAPAEGRTEPTRERVVRAAIVIADAEGLAGVSMRRIATELGIATMSLYRYVSSRDALITQMADTVIGDRPLPPTAPPGWRARISVSAHLIWNTCKQHPWLAHALNMTRPQLIPNGMDHTEWILHALHPHQLDLDTQMHIVVSVLNYVRGVAFNIEPELRAIQDTGLTDEQWMTAQKPARYALTSRHRYPHLSNAVRNEVDMTLDSAFEFGLARLLDGITTLINGLERPSMQ